MNLKMTNRHVKTVLREQPPIMVTVLVDNELQFPLALQVFYVMFMTVCWK